MGFASNCTKAFEANIIPTATVSSKSSLCLCCRSISSGDVTFSVELAVIQFENTEKKNGYP